VATPKRLLTRFQKELLAEDWTQVANHPQIQVKRIKRDGELPLAHQNVWGDRTRMPSSATEIDGELVSETLLLLAALYAGALPRRRNKSISSRY